MAGNYDWLIPVVTAIAGGLASKEEAKMNNRSKTVVDNQTRTPYMAETINPQLQAIAQLLANNYARHLSKRYPGGTGMTIDPGTISAMFGGNSPAGVFWNNVPKAQGGLLTLPVYSPR